ncbi:MAG TPA: PLP-dependent transferase, partial [Usitatibacteraceae bacterium]|nr:PLP-dependent transferase [Usitatibacteraceae bacterium]
IEPIYGFVRTAGSALSPFNAWVCLKGMETLGLRMKAQSEAALQLATWLEAQRGVKRVHYPGLASHPQNALAMHQAPMQGAVVSFEVEGGREAAWRVIDSVRMISITANLGDTRTTITHPASTTHGRLTQAQRDASGVSDGLIRVAVGLEDLADIENDVSRGMV